MMQEKGDPYLPCLTEAANSCSVQAQYNGKETVEVPLCFTAVKCKRRCSLLICHWRGQCSHAYLDISPKDLGLTWCGCSQKCVYNYELL